eukprot:COSAG05_NODE_886_length_6751_cov_151.638906_6_plen_58_part_00
METHQTLVLNDLRRKVVVQVRFLLSFLPRVTIMIKTLVCVRNLTDWDFAVVYRRTAG